MTLALLFAACAGPAQAANQAETSVPRTKASAPATEPAKAASAHKEAQPTGAGQRIYERTRGRLLQVRTLLKTQDSQSSVGSGFLVDDGPGRGQLLVTNYHVVGQFALQPTRYRLVYATVDGVQGALELLAFDVLHLSLIHI